MTMYRRVSTRVAPLGNQTISQLNPMAAHRIADDSDPTRSPELTEREAAAAIDVVKKYATSFGVPAKELSGKMIVAFALNVSRIEMGTRLNAAITNHGAIANVLQDVISYLRTKGITSDSAVHQFQEFAHAIGAVNSEVASADSKITTKISRGLGYDAAGNRTISESAHAKFASGRGPESDYVESERWERILVRIPLLARHLLEEMGRHLQIDPSKTHLSEQESMVFAAVPTIINAYRAEYADLAEAHQTGSRYIPPIRGRADADPATYLFFAGHGTVERTFGGQFYPRMGYATMKGTGEGRYLILPSATSKSTSLIVAKVQGSTEMPARKALLAIAENIQNRNGDVEAPGGAGHLEIVCEGVDDDL
ncbi:hypothetical protein EBR96_07640, partial [bacterium]|nr:hypothetical protein [bacterium]